MKWRHFALDSTNKIAVSFHASEFLPDTHFHTERVRHVLGRGRLLRVAPELEQKFILEEFQLDSFELRRQLRLAHLFAKAERCRRQPSRHRQSRALRGPRNRKSTGHATEIEASSRRLRRLPLVRCALIMGICGRRVVSQAPGAECRSLSWQGGGKGHGWQNFLDEPADGRVFDYRAKTKEAFRVVRVLTCLSIVSNTSGCENRQNARQSVGARPLTVQPCCWSLTQGAFPGHRSEPLLGQQKYSTSEVDTAGKCALI